MITEDQTSTIEFLSAPATHSGVPVERVETHASVVFLAGPRAWKLKRAVRYDYLDFSTAERRKAMCEAEVRINRRTARSLYRRVAPIVRKPDGSLALDGPGVAIDWVIEMTRFDQDRLFDRLAARGALDLELMPPLASAIARFHSGAERRFDHGGRAGMAWVIDGNAQGFAEEGAAILDPQLARRLTDDSRAVLDRVAARLDARRASGCVRQCHGDLHLRNIVLLDGRPTLFDGIEFNDEIACIDVLYDLAFLLMDLWRRELPRHANAILNRYLSDTCDFEALRLLPLFLSCRSAVRAKTNATAARLQGDAVRRAALEDAARGYLTLANRLLRPASPCLIVIGGFSGSGKSTVARALAPSVGAVPGACVVRSDEIRKELCGVDPLTRLGPAAYTEAVTRQVYGTVLQRAAAIVGTGHSAIADAVFARETDREAIERAAAAEGVPFVGIWLEAGEPILFERARLRRADPSDADDAVIRAQLARGAGDVRWNRVLASGGPEHVVQRVAGIVEEAMTVSASPPGRTSRRDSGSDRG